MHWHKSLGSFLLVVILGLSPFQAVAEYGYADFLMTRTLKSSEPDDNNNRWMDIPSRGQMIYYAQNNPFWSSLRYETAGSSYHRKFGEGGCCPTSAAIAFANLLPVADLGKIRPYASIRTEGYGFSTAALNPLNIFRNQGILWLEYAEDFQRYLPLVFGQFAVGNNAKRKSWRAKPKEWLVSTGGTGIGFVPELCNIYGLNYTRHSGKMNLDWVTAVQNGATAIALANSQWHPFATGDGHYVTIVSCDEEYIYIMDPQDKLSYELDRNNAIEVMQSGLIRVKFENYRHLHFGNIYVITNAEVDAKLALLEKPAGEASS